MAAKGGGGGVKNFKKVATIYYRIVVYICLGFFDQFFPPICLIKVYTFINEENFPKIIVLRMGFLYYLYMSI